jgi:hypothetical protein
MEKSSKKLRDAQFQKMKLDVLKKDETEDKKEKEEDYTNTFYFDSIVLFHKEGVHSYLKWEMP